MASLSDMTMWEPSKAFHHLTISGRNLYRTSMPFISPRFWKSPKLREWSSSSDSQIRIVIADLRLRHSLRIICVNSIQRLQESHSPVLFTIEVLNTDQIPTTITAVDISGTSYGRPCNGDKPIKPKSQWRLAPPAIRRCNGEKLVPNSWFDIMEDGQRNSHHPRPTTLRLRRERRTKISTG